eukprot:55928-Eustigmatos_ZCMA.PRE.1
MAYSRYTCLCGSLCFYAPVCACDSVPLVREFEPQTRCTHIHTCTACRMSRPREEAEATAKKSTR